VVFKELKSGAEKPGDTLKWEGDGNFKLDLIGLDEDQVEDILHPPEW
jgi:hypothetical protein